MSWRLVPWSLNQTSKGFPAIVGCDVSIEDKGGESGSRGSGVPIQQGDAEAVTWGRRGCGFCWDLGHSSSETL